MPYFTHQKTIGFFAGPAVSERVYGRAWGFLNHVACVPLNPYDYPPDQSHGLRLLNVTGINNWTNQWGKTPETYQPMANPTLFRASAEMQGVTYQYVMATNVDCPIDSNYMNASKSIPIKRSTRIGRMANL